MQIANRKNLSEICESPLGVTEMADISGPYTPFCGTEFVPFPDHRKPITKVLSSTVALNLFVISIPVPFASAAILKSFRTFWPCGI